MGTSIRTIHPQMRICNSSESKILTPSSITILLSPTTKQHRLSMAIVERMVNIGEDEPNSMISCSYLFETSSSTTLAVIMKADLFPSTSLRIESMNAKRYEVVVLNNHILCSFHHACSVYPWQRHSTKLYMNVAPITHAYGTNHKLETCRSI